METKSIEERAEKSWLNDYGKGYSSDYCNGYVAGATEQDRIARAEERERCIKLACEVHCVLCPIKKRCELIENGTIGVDTWDKCRCFDRVNIRKAMEGGEG